MVNVFSKVFSIKSTGLDYELVLKCIRKAANKNYEN